MTPKFQHDCTQCTFIDHINEMDVYVCAYGFKGGIGSSIIARWGNDGPECTSMPVCIFKDQIRKNVIIVGDGWKMPFRDYLCSQHCADYHKAWMVALVLMEKVM